MPDTQDAAELCGFDVAIIGALTIDLGSDRPGEAEFAWQAEQGITPLFMHDARDLGIELVVARAVEIAAGGPVFVSVNVDIRDPGFALGTGSPSGAA
jgi:agmatinase